MTIKTIKKIPNLSIENAQELEQIPKSAKGLPPFYNCMGVFGCRGSGKTLATINFIRFQAPYLTKIFWISPTQQRDAKVASLLADHMDKIEFIPTFDDQVLDSILDQIKPLIIKWDKLLSGTKLIRKHIDNKKVSTDTLIDILIEKGYIEDDDQNIDDDLIRGNVQAVIDRKPAFLINIDDLLGCRLLESRYNNIFTSFVANHRHWLTNIIINIQNYTSVCNTIRRNMVQVVLFPTVDITLLKSYFTEVGGIFYNLDHFRRVMEYCAERDHGFLMVDKQNDNELRRCFDEILSVF